jgi:hypothetical protein
MTLAAVGVVIGCGVAFWIWRRVLVDRHQDARDRERLCRRISGRPDRYE